ncbi:hypothetical protein BH11BAC7_BH11BAC7_32460 [soil metagenome]
MRLIISLHPDLDEELFTAADWYDLQVHGLGNELVVEFETVVQKVVKNPYAFAINLRNFRHVKLNRFPYILIYEIDGFHLIFQMLIHTSRHPLKRIRR